MAPKKPPAAAPTAKGPDAKAPAAGAAAGAAAGDAAGAGAAENSYVPTALIKLDQFFDTPKGRRYVMIAAIVNFLLVCLMYFLYQLQLQKNGILYEALYMIRDFVAEFDPEAAEKSDVEIVAVAQNLSDELNIMVDKTEVLQAEIDHLLLDLPEWIAHNTNLFYFDTDTADFAGAIEKCAERGANLTSLKFPEEVKFLDTIVAEKKADFWIGYVKNESAGGPGWMWLNGRIFKYTHFPGPPAMKHGRCAYNKHECKIEECWMSDKCETVRRFICRKEPRLYWWYYR
nr:PREDICTED: CD209 antigen [Anolis carolinensis]|eukprot:XP_016853140.1 PREDICTED: CD209 antigen [Anolis carolinensis]